MEEVGVQAVVRGLSQFVGDIGKLNSSLKSIEPSGNIVTRTIEGVNSWFSKLGESMLRVAETALGVLVRDAFLAIVNGLKEIIGATIEAGSEFQTLQLRLTRLDLNTVFNDAAQNVEEFEDVMRRTRSEYRIQKMEWQKAPTMAQAMDTATQAAKDQLAWVQKLAATTPFDFQDIADVYTLARSYSFADDQARTLTQDISDFASGMGLSGTEIQRIIVNMGQMVQQGKVTAREMNDLARGAFVPVNDVLQIMQKETGLTGGAFDDFRNSTKGVELFMKSFSQLVKTRFAGASQDMARTFQGATDNVKDFIKSIFGFGVVTPILDQVGGKIADVLEGLTSPANFAAITLSVGRFGDAISSLLGDLLGLGNIDSASITQRILQGFNRMTAWISQNKDNIIGFLKDFRQTVRDLFDAVRTGDIGGFFSALGVDQSIIDKVIGFKDAVVGTIDTIKAWIEENRPLINEFFSSVGEIIGGVIENLTGMDVGGGGGGLQLILDGIVAFMQYVISNQEGITEFVTNLVKVWGVLQLIGLVMSIVLPPIIALIGFFLGLAGSIIGLISVLTILANPLTWIITAFALIGLGIGGLIGLTAALIENWDKAGPLFGEIWENIKNTILDIFNILVEGVQQGFARWWELTKTNLSNIYLFFTNTFNSIEDLFNVNKWIDLGRKMIEGITAGIKEAGDHLLATLKEIVNAGVELVEKLLDIGSPSRVFATMGEQMMQGLALGIKDAAGLAMGAMENAVMNVATPAMYATAQMGGMVSTQNSYAYNYNLTVNSSSPSEPIVQDFNTLQSLAGA